MPSLPHGARTLPTALRILLPLAAWTASSLATSSGVAAPGQNESPRLAQSEDLSASGLAFVEIDCARDTVLLGEPFELRLRFGIERAFLESNLVQLFQRPLDTKVQVFAPALIELEGVRFLGDAPDQEGASFALEEQILVARPLADMKRAGRSYATFEFRRTGIATRAGDLQWAPPVLRFAHATRFEDNFLHGRVPLDRRDALVRGREGRVTVLAPPEEGRPPDFSGAVGVFTVVAKALPQDLPLGESLELRLTIHAEDESADLSQCTEPRLEPLEWLHLRGTLVEREAGLMTARYDLEPLSEGVFELPPVRFTFYSPVDPRGYRSIETIPIPLVIRGHSPASPTPAPVTAATPPAPGRTPLLPLAGLALGIGVIFLLWRRRRRPAGASGRDGTPPGRGPRP